MEYDPSNGTRDSDDSNDGLTFLSNRTNGKYELDSKDERTINKGQTTPYNGCNINLSLEF